MATCYKCERPTPDGVVECERCIAGLPPMLPGQEDSSAVRLSLEEAAREMARRQKQYLSEFRAIDWDKVDKFEDFKLVITAFIGEIRFHPTHQSFSLIKKFLKE